VERELTTLMHNGARMQWTGTPSNSVSTFAVPHGAVTGTVDGKL